MRMADTDCSTSEIDLKKDPTALTVAQHNQVDVSQAALLSSVTVYSAGSWPILRRDPTQALTCYLTVV